MILDVATQDAQVHWESEIESTDKTFQLTEGRRIKASWEAFRAKA